MLVPMLKPALAPILTPMLPHSAAISMSAQSAAIPWLGNGLAFGAGIADVLTWQRFGAYANMMTGNTVGFAVALAAGNWLEMAFVSAVIASYMLGIGWSASGVFDSSLCGCNWNMNWCGQPSIDTMWSSGSTGRACGDYEQIHICIGDGASAQGPPTFSSRKKLAFAFFGTFSI